MIYSFLIIINNKLDFFLSISNAGEVGFSFAKPDVCLVYLMKESDVSDIRPLLTVLETCVSFRENAVTTCWTKVLASREFSKQNHLIITTYQL